MGTITEIGDSKRQQIREQVEARRQHEEQGQAHDSGNGPPLSSSFVMECFRANEVGDGTLFAELHRGRFVHNCDTKDEWWMFEGHSWRLDKTGRRLNAVEEVVACYLTEAARLEAERKQALADEEPQKAKQLAAVIGGLRKRARQLRGTSRRDSCLRCARTCSLPLTISYDDLDQRPMLFACKNGVIDLATGLLRPGRPEDYLTKASPIEYTGINESAPVWHRFLDDCLADPEVIGYLQKLLGYAMTGLATIRIFPVFYGMRGQNGKSTIMDILYYIMGPMAGPIQSEMLTAGSRNNSSAGPSPDIMDLKGKRLVWGSETEEGQRFAAAKVKLLTGGDPLVGRNPNDRYQTTFNPTHTLFLLTNEKPHAPAHDNAFWIRQRLIEFPYTFVDDEPKEAWEKRADPELAEKLRAEAPGILAWLVKGCLLWQREGLATPEKIKKATAQYRRNEDRIADFIDHCCEVHPERAINATELYKAFKEWWRENVNQTPLTQRKFGDLMTMRFAKQTSGTTTYFGLGLKDKGEVPKGG